MSLRKTGTGAGAATTALWLGAALLLHSGFSPASGVASPMCPDPRESESAAGWTTLVSCSPDASPLRELRGPARLLFGLSLDLNRADSKALEVLPRIGPSRAAAIVRAREEAEFTSVAELVRVRGIGPKTLAGLAGWVEVGGAQ